MQEPPSPPPADADRVEISVPLRSAYLSTVRTMTATLAADTGFTIDEIDDVRLGLGEVVAAYLEQADDGDRAVVSFFVGDASLRIVVRPERTVEVQFDELATGILDSVVDTCEVTAEGVTLVKRAVERAASVDPTR